MMAGHKRARGWLALAGLFLALAFFLAVWLQGAMARARQVGMNRGRASLTAALNDLRSTGGTVFAPKPGRPPGRVYDGIWISPCSKTVVMGGESYQLALRTADWDSAGFKHDWLAVTTNLDFIWMDDERGPKLIPPGYQVSRWQRGY